MAVIPGNLDFKTRSSVIESGCNTPDQSRNGPRNA
jgi:hypothetical protein